MSKCKTHVATTNDTDTSIIMHIISQVRFVVFSFVRVDLFCNRMYILSLPNYRTEKEKYRNVERETVEMLKEENDGRERQYVM